MTNTGLPEAVERYVEASNRHDVEGYAGTFSEHGKIQEDSLGRDYVGKKEISEYFTAYFVETNTQTTILDYVVQEDEVHMNVLFKGDFAGKEAIGRYRFYLKQGRIEWLTADLA